MKQTPWFDRTFDFTSDENIFPGILERLAGTPIRIHHKLRDLPNEQLVLSIGQEWSLMENLGHLLDLEPLWVGRLEDILGGEETLRPADLENRRTFEANHNSKDFSILFSQFEHARNELVDRLKTLEEKDVFRFALHPRLKTPMRMLDLFLFVAEHDDHHLAKMTEITGRIG